MSDQDTTVFEQTSSEPTTTQATSTPEVNQEVTSTPITDYADLLKTIQREDGTQKYANVPDAITALQKSQEFIETLKAENARYKSEVEKRAAAEEVLEQIKATKTEEATPSPEIDLSQIDTLIAEKINSTLSATEQAKVAQQNVDSVISTMIEKFGSKEKAEEQYVKAAQEAGISVDKMNELATASPQAVFKLAGLTGGTQAMPALSEGSINTEALQPTEQKPSVRVKAGATTNDMVSAWRAAGQS